MSDARWEDGQRLEAWAGELRVNLLRCVALAVFYAYHLVNVYVLRDAKVTPGFHLQVSLAFFLWAVFAAALYHTLKLRYAPPWLKYVAVGFDLAFVTLLCVLHPDGPRSSLMLLYFLVVASAPLRLSLRLVHVATFGAVAGAAVALAQWVFVAQGTERYFANADGVQVGPQAEALFVLSLLACGLFAGQSVRQTRRLLEGYPVRVVEPAAEARP